MRVAFQVFISTLLFATSLMAATEEILPKAFSGWQQDASTKKTSSDAGDVDANNAAALKEYGFKDEETATYAKAPDRKLGIKIARFEDATGAYGAYTLYSQPGMQTESIGQLGESAGDRVQFAQGNMVVEVKFDRVNAMSAAEMRELADDLPLPASQLTHLPDLPKWLPESGFIQHSVKYAVGQRSYEAARSSIPVSAIDFSKSPEILTAQYRSDSGTARLMLISYPTPQIAGGQLRKLEKERPTLESNGVGNFQLKRSGPLLAIVTGDISPSDAKSLLASVNWEADVTYNEPTFLSRKNNIGNLIVAAFSLIGLILAFALFFGIAFGGLRVILKRFYPDRFVDRPEDASMITLNLRD
jgi:hypothetical protein